jgi:hypothetical protein
MRKTRRFSMEGEVGARCQIAHFNILRALALPDLYDTPEFRGKVGGWGETAWIRGGGIVLTSGHGFHPECFGSNTRALLDAEDSVQKP